MWRILKDPRIFAVAVVLAFLMMQGIRVERTNPPARSEISTRPDIRPLLHKACYSCHSNETAWPWYSRVSPASWLIAYEVRSGRQRLNFSEWGNYRASVQSRKLEDVAQKVLGSDMPPWYYAAVRRDASLTQSDRCQVWAWATTESNALLK
jgi:hypothetical protein